MNPSILMNVAAVALLLASGCSQAGEAKQQPKKEGTMTTEHSFKSEAEWRQALTPEEYHIMREKGTERAFTGAYYNTHDPGKYLCKGCGQELFSSETKYDSGSGWPSFYKPAAEGAVTTHEDRTHGMVRTEITCARCGSHLGHVFDDGPRPTGLRYCTNSASLKFVPDSGANKH